jgi:hypothetical protein
VENPKIYGYSKDLEAFFDIQMKKLLPKYYKSSSLKFVSNNQLGAMSFQDYMDEEMDDPTDADYMTNNSAKRKRSTPSI